MNPSIPDRSEKKENVQLEMRNYQYKLFQKSKADNSIVVLETGTGKTMIAIYLIYYNLSAHNLQKKVVFSWNSLIILLIQ